MPFGVLLGAFAGPEAADGAAAGSFFGQDRTKEQDLSVGHVETGGLIYLSQQSRCVAEAKTPPRPCTPKDSIEIHFPETTT